MIFGIFGTGPFTGCTRSTLLRSGDGAIFQPSQTGEAVAGPRLNAAPEPASNAVVVPALDAVGKASPPRAAAVPSTGPVETAPPAPGTPDKARTPSETTPGTAPPRPVEPPMSDPALGAPETQTTPLLDAAIERVAAVMQHQQNEIIAADNQAPPAEPGSPSKPETDTGTGPRAAPGSSAIVLTSSSPKTLETPPSVDSTQRQAATSNGAPEPPDGVALVPSPLAIVVSEEKPAPAPPPAAAAPAPAQPGPLASSPDQERPKASLVAAPPLTKQPEEKGSAATPIAIDDHVETSASSSAIAAPPGLGVGKVRLCRRVRGFGSFEAIDESHVKPGQPLLVYCELIGMQYEARSASFVSRLSSKIEIVTAAGGPVVFSHEYGPEEDVCGSARRDFYVNYRVELPRSLVAGPYVLRLTQTDLVAKKTASAEISFAIVP